jgi:hypothetical protein
MNLLQRRSQPRDDRATAWPAAVTIRLAGPPDSEAIDRVAERDSRSLPPAPHLVAERDGAIQAVLSLRTGDAVADPFRPTAELVRLLRAGAGGRP